MIALIARIVKNTGRSWALSGDLCVWSTGSPRLFNAISISTRYVRVKIGINLINTHFESSKSFVKIVDHVSSSYEYFKFSSENEMDSDNADPSVIADPSNLRTLRNRSSG